MPVPAVLMVKPNPAPEITPVENVTVPPVIAVNVAPLLRVIAPVKVEAAAVLPPILMVPVLPA